jgi:hypothetical protein
MLLGWLPRPPRLVRRVSRHRRHTRRHRHFADQAEADALFLEAQRTRDRIRNGLPLRRCKLADCQKPFIQEESYTLTTQNRASYCFRAAMRKRAERDRYRGRHNPVVYFIWRDGFIKIGYATRLKQRIYELRIGAPTPLHVVHTLPDDEERTLESALHKQFAEYHISGEWYEEEPVLDCSSLKVICRHSKPRDQLRQHEVLPPTDLMPRPATDKQLRYLNRMAKALDTDPTPKPPSTPADLTSQEASRLIAALRPDYLAQRRANRPPRCPTRQG